MSTPNYTDKQVYLGPSPDSLGVSGLMGWPHFLGSWTRVGLVDGDWQTDHEDLKHLTAQDRIVTVGASPDYAADAQREHGTQTLGVLAARPGPIGMTGIVAAVGKVVFSRPFTLFEGDTQPTLVDAHGIIRALMRLAPGDVLLVERDVGEWCAEVNPIVRELVAAVVQVGVHVVMPAGNAFPGPFDDPSKPGYVLTQPGHDTGSIVVGAGYSAVPMLSGGPPPRSFGTRTYGSRINVQGWVNSVATTSTDDDTGTVPSPPPSQSYTLNFVLTSAASAQIAGVVALAADVGRRLSGGAPISPALMRKALIATGSPQQDAPGSPAADYPIGPLPDVGALLRALRRSLLGIPVLPHPWPSLSLSPTELFVVRGVANGLNAIEIAWLLERDASALVAPGFGPSPIRGHTWATYPGRPSSLPRWPRDLGALSYPVREVERMVLDIGQRAGVSSALELGVWADGQGFTQ